MRERARGLWKLGELHGALGTRGNGVLGAKMLKEKVDAEQRQLSSAVSHKAYCVASPEKY